MAFVTLGFADIHRSPFQIRACGGQRSAFGPIDVAQSSQMQASQVPLRLLRTGKSHCFVLGFPHLQAGKVLHRESPQTNITVPSDSFTDLHFILQILLLGRQ